MADLDFEQRQELTKFLEIALDEDALAEKVSDAISERDRLRERVEALEKALGDVTDVSVELDQSAYCDCELHERFRKAVEAARKLLESKEGEKGSESNG